MLNKREEKPMVVTTSSVIVSLKKFIERAFPALSEPLDLRCFRPAEFRRVLLYSVRHYGRHATSIQRG